MKLKQIALAVLLSTGLSGAMAVPVVLTGSTIKVTYDTSIVGLFGAPTLSGDILSWAMGGSPGFSATSSAGYVTTNSTFVMTIEALAGHTLSSFAVGEAGDYLAFNLAGSGLAGVDVLGQLRVKVGSSAPMTSPIAETVPFVTGTTLPSATTDWTASATPIIVAAGTGSATVWVQNILAAYAFSPMAYGFIEKKEATLTTVTTPIPEPETYAMMLAGLGAIGFLASRRRVG